MRKKIALISMVVAIALLSTSTTRADVTIYSDGFNRTGTFNGTSPDVTSGLYGGTAGATWLTGSHFYTDGTTANSGGSGKAYLPFTPQAGYIYTLSVVMDNVSPTTKWAGLGFDTVNFSSPPDLNSTFNISGPMLLNRQDSAGGGGQWYDGSNWTTLNTGDFTLGYNTFKIVLDTQTDVNNWTATLFVNGTQEIVSTYAAAGWTRNAIEIGGESDYPNNVMRADSLSLTVNVAAVPEPSTLVLVGFGLLGTLLVGRRSRKIA